MRARAKRYTEAELANISQEIVREGLWTPRSALPSYMTAGPSVAVYLRYSDLFPGCGNLKKRYWDALQKAPKLDAVVVLSMVNGLLTLKSADAALHPTLNARFLQRDLYRRVSDYKPGGPASTVVFNRIGCLNLIRHLLAYGSDKPTRSKKPQAKDVGELMLLANEFLQDDAPTLPEKPSDIDVASLMAPTWDINNRVDLAYALSRMHVMLRRILPGNDKGVRDLSKAAGIDPRQIAIDKVPLDDFLAIVFGLYSHGLKINKDMRNALFDMEKIFKKIGPSGLLPRFMSARSRTPSLFRSELGGGRTPSRKGFFQELQSHSFIGGSLVEFRRRPLLMLDKKRAVILDLQFLAELLTVGVYYAVFDSLPTNRRERFREMWGRMFELYVVGLLQQAYPVVTGLARPLLVDVRFPGGQIDALLDFGNSVLVFEVKSSLLTERAKRTGKRAPFEHDVKKKFVRNERGKPKGVTQLANACQAIMKGLIDVAAASPTIYPVLVSDERACEVPCFNSYLDGILKAQLGEASGVRPLSVMSINEFEEVLGEASAGHLDWFKFLDSRFDNGTVSAHSVHQALYNWLRLNRLQPVRDEARSASFEEASADILKKYQAEPSS